MRPGAHPSGELSLLTSQGQADALPRTSLSSSLLPVEIGFLVDRGFRFETLYFAAALAVIIDVTSDEVLVRCDLVDEDEYYRALASELDLPFLSRPVLSAQARYPESIHAGIGPLESPASRYAFAPRGSQILRLLQSRRSFGAALAITTPTALRNAVLSACRRRIAHQAALMLPSHAPDLSSRDGATTGQALALSSTIALLLLLAVARPEPTIALATAGLTPIFLGMVLLRLAAASVPPVAPPDPALRQPDSELPPYTIIVALYRERRILPRLVAALSALDYPAPKLDIKLVIEADDRETAEGLSRLDLPARFEIIVAPPGLPRTKPRALNVALPLARGTFVVVYDAEDVPDPDQLRLAVRGFAERPAEVACLQARLTIDNASDTWLTRFFAIEYASLFEVLNPGLTAFGSPIPLGGTSNHFRTSVMREVLGWDAWNVTEDADLGIRLARLGYRTADLPSWTREEAPLALRGWMRQRTRWLKGFVQTSITHSRHPLTVLRQLGPFRFSSAVTMTFGTVLTALVYPLFTALSLLTLATGGPVKGGGVLGTIWALSSVLLFVFGLAAIYIPALIAVRRRRMWSLLPWIVPLPLYYGLVSIAGWRSLWELARDPFRWNKTEHGLARTMRGSPPRSCSGDPARLPRARGSGSRDRSAGRRPP